jgi:hypothetical protein
MPQFQPYLWLNLLTWSYLLFIILLSYIHLNFLPNILKVKFIRLYLLFK